MVERNKTHIRVSPAGRETIKIDFFPPKTYTAVDTMPIIIYGLYADAMICRLVFTAVTTVGTTALYA